MKLLVAMISGILFGMGLTISQMVDPNKVTSFLDITGGWDPSLIFVMAAAFGIFSLGYWYLISHRTHALTGGSISLGSITVVNKPLIVGGAIFGLGWGLTGICPGPAVANLGGGEPKMLVFVLVMVLGMKVSEWIRQKFL